jgi:hypothetical protein
VRVSAPRRHDDNAATKLAVLWRRIEHLLADLKITAAPDRLVR